MLRKLQIWLLKYTIRIHFTEASLVSIESALNFSCFSFWVLCCLKIFNANVKTGLTTVWIFQARFGIVVVTCRLLEVTNYVDLINTRSMSTEH